MDRIPLEKRSQIMSLIRAKNTKLELFFLHKLKERGLTAFVAHSSQLIGRPDLVHKQSRMAIFIDSCFWHGCKYHLRLPKSHQRYWVNKIAKNRERDRTVRKRLQEEGWLVLRIWEHSIKNPRALNWWLTRIQNLIHKKQSKYI